MSHERFWVGFVDVSEIPKEQQNFGWRVISFVQGSPLVHAFLVFHNDTSQDPVVYETTETTYQKRSLSSRMENSNCVFYEINTCRAQKLQDKCEKKLGEIYDYSGIAGLGLLILAERALNFVFSFIVKWLYKQTPKQVIIIGNPIHMKTASFCTEAIVDLCRSANFEIFPDWWESASITPDIMNRYMLSEPDTFKPKQIIKQVLSL